jgi:drug/metabolite transporter (DMT)-like permease
MKEKLNSKKVASFLLGIVGVYFLVSTKNQSRLNLDFHFYLSILACLAAALLYAISGIYIKLNSKSFDSSLLAGTTQLLAFFFLIPFSYFSPAQAPLTQKIILNMLMLSLACSALAYILYFKLIEQVGPSKALSVTYLMPIFGIFWGHLFLGENVSVAMLVGMSLILTGVFFSFKKVSA